jgi:hypothetical protein
MIVPGVFLGVIVGLLRGGKLERLGELGLKALPVVWLALALRLSVGILARQGFIYAAWVQVVAYLLFFGAVGMNLSVGGMKLFGLGSLLNFIVIVMNGGAMPVSPQAMAVAGLSGQPAGTHMLMTAETPLWFLADIIPVWMPLPNVISVGDILIVVGIFIFIQRRMLFRDTDVGLVSLEK